MNSKKRWIITAIAALALAAVIVIGIVLNHSADRVLKATDGTETTAEGPAPAEETAEAQPAEEMLEMVLPAGENGTDVSSSLMAVPENTEPAGEEPEEALALPETPEGNMAGVRLQIPRTKIRCKTVPTMARMERQHRRRRIRREHPHRSKRRGC